jgi:hypothetical protein
MLLRLYETMVRMPAAFEEKTAELYKAGTIKGTAHSYGRGGGDRGGHERLPRGGGIFVGSYHRGHGHCIAKGARTDRMMAELMGRATGYCGGLGGSMHIADMDLPHSWAPNGVGGAAMPLGVGAALAAKIRGTGEVAVAYFGDGASNQGVFPTKRSTSPRFWALPIIFLCENNQYALNTAYRYFDRGRDHRAPRAGLCDAGGDDRRQRRGRGLSRRARCRGAGPRRRRPDPGRGDDVAPWPAQHARQPARSAQRRRHGVPGRRAIRSTVWPVASSPRCRVGRRPDRIRGKIDPRNRSGGPVRQREPRTGSQTCCRARSPRRIACMRSRPNAARASSPSRRR